MTNENKKTKEFWEQEVAKGWLDINAVIDAVGFQEYKKWMRDWEKENKIGEFKKYMVPVGENAFFTEGPLKNQGNQWFFESSKTGVVKVMPSALKNVLDEDLIKVFAVKKSNGLWDINPVYVVQRNDQKKHPGKVLLSRKGQKVLVLDGRPSAEIELHRSQDFNENEYVFLKFPASGLVTSKVAVRIEKFDNEAYGVESRWIMENKLQELTRPCKEMNDEDIQEINQKIQREFLGDPFVTIDGEGSRDLDDAIYVEKLNDGYLLKVAVADVSEYVKKNSQEDMEAQKSMTSFYAPHFVRPMIAEKLAHETCSLNANEKKSVLVCSMEIDSEGAIKKYSISENWIQIEKRCSYDEVNEWLNGDRTIESERVKETLRVLLELTKKMAKKAKENGRYDFGGGDIELVLNEKGDIQNICNRSTDTNAQMMVEESMLAANQSVALWLEDKLGYGVFRNHPGFKEGGLEKVMEKIEELNLPRTQEMIENDDRLIQWIDASKENVAYEELKSCILGNLEGAQYSHENKGHFSLGINAYVHFTSPIRRYADLIVHRLVKSKLRNEDPAYTKEELIPLLEKANEMTIRTSRAANEIKKILYLKFLKSQDSQKVYKGRVLTINEKNIWVEMDILSGKLEFSVSTLSFKKQGYNWNIESKQWINHEGTPLKHNQQLEFKIKSLSVEGRSIDWSPWVPDFSLEGEMKNKEKKSLAP